MPSLASRKPTSDHAAWRDRLFGFLAVAQQRGARFARVGDMDRRVDEADAAFFLKHDVHGMSLDGLIDFATHEKQMGAIGSYFFMAPNHPLTRPFYSFAEQLGAMRRVRELGHEIGLHIDPYFLMDQRKQPLREIISEMLAVFAAEGLPLTAGNTHGNSKFKMPDNHGYGTTFDLFDELCRQPDFPALSDVPVETAAIIRANRTSLRSLGFTHWADMPMWSARHGYVVTNFITDNQLAKRGTIEFLAQADTIGQYKLTDRQPPGSRTESPARECVACAASSGDLVAGSAHVDVNQPACGDWFARLARHPTLFLIHPEHYC